jgi:hypothetical protein
MRVRRVDSAQAKHSFLGARAGILSQEGRASEVSKKTMADAIYPHQKRSANIAAWFRMPGRAGSPSER